MTDTSTQDRVEHINYIYSQTTDFGSILPEVNNYFLEQR